jgi:hypothetical protein
LAFIEVSKPLEIQGLASCFILDKDAFFSGACLLITSLMDCLHGNEILLKLPRGEVYDMLIVKTEKCRFEDMTRSLCHLSPHMAPS